MLSDSSQRTAGILLLTILAVEFGGVYLLRVVQGAHVVTDFQRTFHRAGHAHAGVLVSLSLVCLLVADAAEIDGGLAWVGRHFPPYATILIPAGFFLSSMGRGVERPGRLVWLLYAGVVVLAVGVGCLGLALLVD